MVPTAVSQIVEQIINAAVSIGAAYVLFHYGLKIDAVLGTKTAAYAYGAAGSTRGTGLGALSGLLFLAFLVASLPSCDEAVKMAVSREERREESTAEILLYADSDHYAGYFKYGCLQSERNYRSGYFRTSRWR